MIFDRFSLRAGIVVILLSCACGIHAAECDPVLTLSPSPDWRGQPRGSTTGLAADFNGDDLMDLVSIQADGDLIIYFNTGSCLAPNPGWRRPKDEETITNCALSADLQADGYPELILFRYNQTHDIPACEVYANTTGVPGMVPVWQSQVHFSYSGDVGDVDGDGIPDLYIAVYDDADVLYRGTASGVFETAPVWTSGDTGSSADAEFLDIDNDGDLDVAVCSMGDPQLRIYTNTSGSLSSMPTWECTQDFKALMITSADADKDGFPEVAIGAWTSPSVVFWNVSGVLETNPRWSALPDTSLEDKYYWSTVAWADINHDGYPEIAMGNRWWTPGGQGGDRVRVFLNSGGNLSDSATWESDTQRTIYGMGFGEFSGDGYPDLWTASGDAPEIYSNHLDTWNGLGVSLSMPARQFAPGNLFAIQLDIMNPGQPLPQTPVFVILEMAGSYWCAPAWTDMLNELSYFLLDVPSGPSQLQVLDPFPWPDVQGSMNGLCVYAAMTNPEMTEILGQLDLCYFGYHP